MSDDALPALRQETEDMLLNAALRVITRDGWAQVRFTEIAAEAATNLARIYEAFPDRGAIVQAMMRRADRAVLSAATPSAPDDDGPGDHEDGPRDRLFDVLMRRFDALEPMKPALRAMTGARPDPVAVATLLVGLPQSMRWMMIAAGLSVDGLGGRLRLHGLCLLYTTVFQTWLRDDGADLDKTMRALDQALRRAEPIAAWTERWR